MAQVIIVSNRLPVNVKKVDGKLEFHPSIGGLATGLSSYINGRKNIWVGWPGIAKEALSEQEKQTIASELMKQHCCPVFLSQHQIDDFYNGYSNTVLWPLLHSMPSKQNINHEQWWASYRAVNKLFAETVLSVAQADSTIWVHDYQLLLLPELLRAEQAGGHIGFFLHTPFPKFKAFNNTQHAKQLLTGILGADLAGFHTTSYSEQFILACQDSGIGIAGQQQVILPTRSVQVKNFPIGIDYEKYAQAGALKPVRLAIKRYKRKYGRRKLIVAVDRLEPSKGLDKRLEAYRDFLTANHKLQGKVVLVMVAAPSRTDIPAYQQLKIRLEELSSSINSMFGTPRWQPVDFIYESLPFEEVSALYQLADVAFIAPLRDGMNLVAKEYVASKRKRGVLILSQTAGAAEELSDALLVDPRKPAALIEALQQAFNMPRRELRRRLKSMQQQISGNTIDAWAGTFVKTLQQPILGARSHTHALRGKSRAQLLNAYRQSKKRLLLFDYDGSLVSFSEDYRAAQPPKALLDILGTLANDTANEVVIISGRQASDLETWFGGLKVSLVAEHGAIIKRSGATAWQTIEHVETKWKKMILPLLEKYSALTPGAMIEVKAHSLVWHYRPSPPYYTQKYAVIIKRVLKPLLKKYGVRIYQGHKMLEIKDPRINKGDAARRWLKTSHTFVLAIGDDYTDEDLFTALADTAYTIKVGPGRTTARYRLKKVAEVSALLKASYSR